MRRVLFAMVIAGSLVSTACKDSKTGSGSGTGSVSGSAAGTAPASGSGSAAGTGTAAGTGAAPGTGAAAGTATEPGPGTAAVRDDGLADHGTGSDGRSLYYARPLTAADLDGRTLRDLALMRNTVYARAGHSFRKAWLRDHFTAMPWYQPQPRDDNSKITAVDRANVKLIAEREVAAPRDELVARRTALASEASLDAGEEIELRLLNEQLGGTGGATAAAPRAKVSPLEDPSQLDRLLTLDDLSDLSQRDLRILRNTVYARHGRPFKSDTLIAWFSDKDWYQEDPSFTDADLTATDRKNVRLIRSVEDSLGGPMTEHEQKVDEGWFDGA